MIRIGFSIFIVLFLNACSLKTAPNQWEHKAKNATQLYIKNFLSDKEEIASQDYQRAIKHAKSSANLEMLGKIYLTKCAMKRIVGKKSNCSEYQSIEKLITIAQLQSYKRFLEDDLNLEDIVFLNQKYHAFSRYYLKHQYKKAIEVLLNTKDVVSMLIMSSLVKDKLSQKDIGRIIDTTSFYGYKKATKYWLEYKALKFDDQLSKEILKVMEN